MDQISNSGSHSVLSYGQITGIDWSIAFITTIVSVTIVVLIMEWAKTRREGLRARIKLLYDKSAKDDLEFAATIGENVAFRARIRNLERADQVHRRLFMEHGPGRCNRVEKPQRPEDLCKCGHTRMAHIYWEGACRSGVSKCRCPGFSLELIHPEAGHPNYSGGVSS